MKSFRLALITVFSLFFVWTLSDGALAQADQAELSSAKAKQFLDLMSDPEVKTWLERKVASGDVQQQDPSLADAIANWEATIRARLAALLSVIPRIPQEFSNAAAVLSRDVNSGRPGLVAGVLAILIIVGFGVEWFARRALAGFRAPEGTSHLGQAALLEVIGLAAFALASSGLFLVFDWPPLLRRIVLTLLLAFIAARILRTAVGLLLAFVGKGDGTSADTAEGLNARRFWVHRISLLAGILLFGWAITSLMPSVGFSIDMARLTALLCGLGMLAVAIEIIWRRPGKVASTANKSLLTLYLIALWLAWVAGLLGLLWLGLYALLLPFVVRSVGNIAQIFASRAQRSDTVGVVIKVLTVRGARAVVIGLAVAWLAYIWRVREAALSAGETGSVLMSGLFNGIIVLIVADLIWHLSKSLISHKIEASAAAAGSDPDAQQRSGRLRTLLPIFRNTLAALIAAVTILTILAGLGVQIAPLIAGAGIFGVAIGFGSQTLVKDVLSGVFYMLDDAFRVGEYIQSGSYKGTVESFSLRSVRLRHHRGPIFTVPFGELGAVQNASRDWVIDKMTINVTYDANIDLARKLIKKIGLELAADPEFAPNTLQPLKMQGVDSFGDFAIVLRLKIMTKPGTQFSIKRRAYMMIKQAFDENGIKIAVPTVHVEGGAQNAAAGQEMMKRKKAAEQAVEPA